MKLLPAVVVAAVLGLLSSTNFAPLAFEYTMVVAVAGLFALIWSRRYASKWGALLVGASYGLAFMAPTIWWMNLVDNLAWVALVAGLVVYYALTGLALTFAARLRWWPVAMAAVWLLGEAIRGRFPLSGFPWARLGHTALDTPWESYARIIGMAGTSFLLALIASLAAFACVQRGSIRTTSFVVVGILSSFVVGAFLPLGLAGDAGERTVAVVQGGTPGPFLSWPRGEIFEMHLNQTALLDAQVDFVVWPENATDIDPTANARAAAAIESLSEQVDAPILVGGILNGPTDDTAYNAGIVWDHSGPQEQYLKQKVVPYGEYVPFRAQLGSFVPRFDRDIPRDILAGEESVALPIAGTYAGATICWDVAYDDIVYDSVNEGAEFVVVQTSNASFEGSAQPQQQWEISRLRAIETGRYVLVPSTNGISGVIDATGTVVAQAPLITPTTLVETIRLASDKTLAIRWAPTIELLIIVGALIAVVFGARRTKDIE